MAVAKTIVNDCRGDFDGRGCSENKGSNPVKTRDPASMENPSAAALSSPPKKPGGALRDKLETGST
jgi:hypothetical protein